MGLSDRIAELNAFELSRFVPLRLDAAQIGWVRRDRLTLLAAFSDCFVVEDTGLRLAPRLSTYESRTDALAKVCRALFESGVIRRWRGESYPVVPLADRRLETAPLFEIERAAVPFFGIRAFGIHVNGIAREDGALHLWFARRSPKADLHPGKLDNLVAGGQPAGLSPFENMIKEAEEEAGIGDELARRAEAVGHISYCVETAEGLGPATMFVYDLELPEGFVPRNGDGEIASFHRYGIAAAMDLVAEGRELKPNSNLVVIDFALRRGVIGKDHPDFAELGAGLRQ